MLARTILFALLAGPALADCPVAADLASGIRLISEDGTREVYLQQGPGVVEMTGTYPDGYTSRTLLGQGIYVLELVDLIDGQADLSTRLTFAFPMQPGEIPIPAAGDVWQVKTAMWDGYESIAETISARWGSLARVTYGDCSYDMIAGTLSYSSADYSHQEVIHYLPQLGFGALYSYDDADLPEPDVYVVVGIERVEK